MCVIPVWVVPFIIAFAPFQFILDMFNSFLRGDFSVLNELPELFTSVWTAVFG